MLTVQTFFPKIKVMSDIFLLFCFLSLGAFLKPGKKYFVSLQNLFWLLRYSHLRILESYPKNSIIKMRNLE